MMVLIFMIVALLGCEPYRIERHRRSPIFSNPNYVDNVDREVTLEDGTVLIFDSVLAESSYGRGEAERSEPFKIRQELENGEIVFPNAMKPLTENEYEKITNRAGLQNQS